jgi:hypothetical protein
MNDVLSRIEALAKSAPRRLVFAEGDDERVVTAAARLAADGAAQVSLVAEPGVARATAARCGASLEAVTVLDPGAADRVAATRAALGRSGACDEDVARLARDPLYQAAGGRRGRMDCCGGRRRAPRRRGARRCGDWAGQGLSAVPPFSDGAPQREPPRPFVFADCVLIPRRPARLRSAGGDHFQRLVGERHA